MRIMLDTNILVSIAIFDSDKLKEMLINICDNHTLVLSSYIIEELQDVVKRKFENKTNSLSKFLFQLPYELNYISSNVIIDNRIKIRDEKDLPIINSAIVSNVDILITGDKDFNEIKLKKPKIMTVREFLEKY